MLAPPRAPFRPPPPPSPSRSLLGMENVVPPRTQSSSASPFTPPIDRNKPLPPPTPSVRRSQFSPTADKDKPLPERPNRSSSIYSVGSRYSGFTDRHSSYGWEDEPPPVPPLVQPIAYQDTISALLRRRLEEPPSPKSVPSAMSTATLASVGYPQPPLSVSPGSPAMSAMSGPSAADSRNAPSFKEFSRNLQKKKILPVEEPPPLSLPRASPDFRSVSYDSTRLDRSISPRTTDTVDRSLMPAPLSIYKKRDTVIEDQPNVSRYQFPEHEEGSTSRFSTTSSEDSYVIYTGVTQSVRAYVRHKMQKKRDNPKKERKRVMSVASAKYPGMLTAKEYDRRHSSGSRRPSLQQGISSVYKRLSRLSIAGPSGQDQDKKSPRGRQKQLAIPTSAYQKYGAAVWEAPKRQKKAQRSSAPMKTLVKKTNSGRAKRHPSMPGNPTEVAQAFKSGRSQIIQAFGGTKHKLMRSKSEKRREALKQSIRLVGPADLISDGAKNYTV